MEKIKEEQYFVNYSYVFTVMLHRCLNSRRLYLSFFSKKGNIIKSISYNKDRDVGSINIRCVSGTLIEHLIIEHFGGYQYKFNDVYLPELPDKITITNQNGEECDKKDFCFKKLSYRY